MNEIEVGQLLAMAITLDPKMPEPDEDGFMRRLWATMLHDVPRELGQRALVDYYRGDRYAQTREPISPADIVQWTLPRRRPTESERTGLNRATERKAPRAELDPQRIHDGVDLVLSQWQGQRAIRRGDDPEYAMEIAQGETAVRREFLSRPCTHCGAAEGSPCVVPRRGSTPQQLTKSPAHPSRMSVAQDSFEETRARALAALENVVGSAETLSSP